ncbi:MAG: cysteine--tRNA ligase [Parcubacteria group bacterium]|nr:cysteine--tRNA ligase [Parcubacteria group bacterium]
MIHLHNTLTRETEEFKPLRQGEVSMYHCGPTVYDKAHIGNLRSFLFADITRRVFEYNDFKVVQVMNITDVGHLTSDADEGEDKMTAGLKREGMAPTLENMHSLADRYIRIFEADTASLNIKKPDALPRASEFVPQQIELIQRLEAKGLAYITSDGVYFDTGKYPDYGKLGGVADQDHSRIGMNAEKKNPRDFALWKFNKNLGWESPWGKGFPGWHIECSAMSMKYLGEEFDIHTGGVDHITVHHNNEIAQSEAATGRPLAHYWLHNEHVLVNSEKMSKSKGNFFTLEDVVKRGFSPLAYRYFLLQAHYRTQINFTWEALEASQNALNKLHDQFLALANDGPEAGEEPKEHFLKALNDDLNTPLALAELWDVVRDRALSGGEKRAILLDFDRVLGLGFDTLKKEDIPSEVKNLAEEREEARAQNDFAKADMLRKEVEEMGYRIDDTPNGPKILKS